MILTYYYKYNALFFIQRFLVTFLGVTINYNGNYEQKKSDSRGPDFHLVIFLQQLIIV